MRSPHDSPTPSPPKRPLKGLASTPVPRFTPPPQRATAVPVTERLDATISELPPASHLSWAEPPRVAGPVFQLVRVVDGFPLARHVFTQGLVRVGRGEDCDLRLDDKAASRYHALIEQQPGDVYLLHDQLSSNGVKVNGARVERSCRLRDGDVLLLGTTRLVFQTSLTPDSTPRPTFVRPPAPAPPPPRPPAPRPTARLTAPVVVEPVVEPASAVAPDATLAPPSDSSEDLPKPPGSSADGIIFGRTLGVAPARVENDQREAGVAARAFLRATEEKRWSASHLARPSAQHLVARDAFVIGAGDDVDLRVEARLMPRVVAVIVRGLTGFSVSQVAGWPWQSKINGRVVSDQEPIEDGDVLLVAGRQFTFHVGSPTS